MNDQVMKDGDDDSSSSRPAPVAPTLPQRRKREDDNEGQATFVPTRLRLEAIFHPKFDNEKQLQGGPGAIRRAMLERLAAPDRKDYLEVSLKHSGSLLLWSGEGRFYSKNSMANAFCYVGEILLRQHFVRAHWGSDEAAFEACSRYITQHRLTLAFEVVTSVLGDHGDRPHRDFCMLTAVADRTKASFYSTSQVVALAHRFRLPHNDVWIVSEEGSARALLDWYDTSRETGTMTTLQDFFGSENAAQFALPSLLPHADFQGDILEGLVLRLVQPSPTESVEDLTLLSAEAQRLKQLVPASLPDCPDLVASLTNDTGVAKALKGQAVLSTDIRKLFAECKQDQTRFASALKNILVRNDGRRPAALYPKQPQLMATCGSIASPEDDTETRRIAQLLAQLEARKERVDFALWREEHRWLGIVHVAHDQTFAKFQKQMQPDDMPLFRGFVVEMTDATSQSLNNDATSSDSDARDIVMNEATSDTASSNEPLMLKMKFLPYMVRTFCCRNGLRTLRRDGIEAFVTFTDNLFSRWNMSKEARQKWHPFFQGWARFALSQRNARPPLTENNYLSFLETFEKEYEAGQWRQAESGSGNKSGKVFRGLVCVVSPDAQVSKAIASYVAKQVDGQLLDKYQDVRGESMAVWSAVGPGRICPVTIPGDGPGKVRGLLKEFAENVGVILVGCSIDEIREKLLPKKEEGKLIGVGRSWSKTSAAYSVELRQDDVIDTEAMDTTKGPAVKASDGLEAACKKLMESFCHEDQDDGRRGALLFFPSIPGSGKSTVVGDSSGGMLANAVSEVLSNGSRNFHALIGDETPGKFWKQVQSGILKDKASVFLADKNAPPSSWESIAGICATTKSIGIPICPDRFALQTTTIDGMIFPDGGVSENRSHYYPFSMEFLAVCLGRVLARPPGSHAGKLDSGTPRACWIVIKFFAFYRRLSASSFLDSMSNAFDRSGADMASQPLVVPFFCENFQKCPSDLHEALTRALQLQFGFDLKNQDTSSKKVSSDELDSLDQKLRDLIAEHKGWLSSVTVSEHESRASLTGQLKSKLDKLDSPEALINQPDIGGQPRVKLAAIDFSVDSIKALLASLSSDGRITDFFGRASSSGDNNDSNAKCWISNPHVTLVHMEEMTQADLVSTFKPLEGASVPVEAKGILWNERVAALAVNVPETSVDGKRIPSSRNSFVHITIWCHTEAAPKDSNMLPKLVSNGQAKQVIFDAPIGLAGTLSLWPLDKSSR